MDDDIEKDDPVAQAENETDTESTSLKDFELFPQYETLHALQEGNILLNARTLIIKAIMNQDPNEVIDDDEIIAMNMKELNELTAKMSLIDQGWRISTQSSVTYELLLEGRVSPKKRRSFPYGDIREHILQLLQMSIPENAELLKLIKIKNEKLKELYLKKQELQSELNAYKEMIEKHQEELKARVTESEEVVRRKRNRLELTLAKVNTMRKMTICLLGNSNIDFTTETEWIDIIRSLRRPLTMNNLDSVKELDIISV